MFRNYVAEKYEPKKYDLLPEGTYIVTISEVNSPKEPRFGEESVSVKLEIIEGEHTGRLIFDNLYSQHSNEKLVNLSKHKLNGYCAALSRPKLTSILDLLNGRLKVLCKHSQVGEKTYVNIVEYIPLTREETERSVEENCDIPF